MTEQRRIGVGDILRELLPHRLLPVVLLVFLIALAITGLRACADAAHGVEDMTCEELLTAARVDEDVRAAMSYDERC